MAILGVMFKSWRLGRLFGFPIEINLSFLLLLGLVFVAFGRFSGVFIVLLAFASVVLHELGHAIVARRLGVRVAGIELGFLGGAAKMENIPRTPRHELMIAAAGPAVSLMLGGAFLGTGLAIGSPLVAQIGWINFVIAGFNLIPALPMDGGRILRALLVPRFGYVRATDISVIVARAAAIGFALLGLFAGFYMLLILAPFLWLMGSRERVMARMMPEQGWVSRHGVEVLDRDDRGGWGSPFDRRSRFDNDVRRYTIVRRNGRVEIVALD